MVFAEGVTGLLIGLDAILDVGREDGTDERIEEVTLADRLDIGVRLDGMTLGERLEGTMLGREGSCEEI